MVPCNFPSPVITCRIAEDSDRVVARAPGLRELPALSRSLVFGFTRKGRHLDIVKQVIEAHDPRDLRVTLARHGCAQQIVKSRPLTVIEIADQDAARPDHADRQVRPGGTFLVFQRKHGSGALLIRQRPHESDRSRRHLCGAHCVFGCRVGADGVHSKPRKQQSRERSG